MKIASVLSQLQTLPSDENLKLASQVGVTDVVIRYPGPDYSKLHSLKTRIESFGLNATVVEGYLPLEEIKMASVKRNDEIEQFKTYERLPEPTMPTEEKKVSPMVGKELSLYSQVQSVLFLIDTKHLTRLHQYSPRVIIDLCNQFFIGVRGFNDKSTWCWAPDSLLLTLICCWRCGQGFSFAGGP